MFAAELGWTVVEPQKKPKLLPRAPASNVPANSGVVGGTATNRKLSSLRRGGLSRSSSASLSHTRLPAAGLAMSGSTASIASWPRCSSDIAGSGSQCRATPRSDNKTTPEERCHQRWMAERTQQDRCASLSMHRRHKRVESTLQAVGSAFDPAEGLADVAAALAEEALAKLRTKDEQSKAVGNLAQPRIVPRPVTPEDNQAGPIRTFEEQQAHIEELMRPREEVFDPPETFKEIPTRSAAVQQQRCMEMARPRGEMEIEEDSKPWREELLSRANALVPEEVSAAQALLAEMRARAREAGGGSRPSSAQQRTPGGSEVAGARRRRRQEQVIPTAGCEELSAELRSAVDEVLWAVLLQIRCCRQTCGDKDKRCLDDRLGNLLISTVGPTLRPIARRVLGPGASTVKRLRLEFNRLAVHLGFRESDDMEPPPLAWNAAEFEERLQQVKACRDHLLGMDTAKTSVVMAGLRADTST
eukprot:TRINITY_DN23045_c0_g1_i1.p1 TRINITY_DN23045_c0_g1~~TRINITY_DN23045_c0_g1_i1.p1  ORF type:complete len:472 (+),score=91.50 TRINITY_DN23045_c0_g1_i1:188-1603(+)